MHHALISAVMGHMCEDTDGFRIASEKWGPGLKCTMERSPDSRTKCYRFYGRTGQTIDLTLRPLIVAAMVSTWCYGEDSYQVWRLMGNIATVVVALCYHSAIKTNIRCIFMGRNRLNELWRAHTSLTKARQPLFVERRTSVGTALIFACP